MTNFLKYAAYRDSGVEWLGEVPVSWEVLKSKYLWKELIDLSSMGEETLLSVSQYTGVNTNDNDSRSGSLVGYKKVSENDLVINIMLAWLGGLGLSSLNGIVSPAYAVYRLTRNFEPKYIHYLYRTSTYLDEFARRSKGVVPSRWRMYTDDFGQVLTLLPPKSEQTRIATFLDQKTAQIDQAIAQKERLIELLKERRQILIHNAVTRGLNPNVRMKDSDVEWIDQIPEHWGMADLRRFTVEHRQGYYSEKGYDETGHKVVRITDLLDENIIDISDSPYYSVNEESRRRYELKNGDFLFQRTGSHKKIGVFYSEEPSVYASYLIRFRFSEKISHKFLLCFLNSQAYTVQLNQQIHGGVNPNIHAENIKICKILYPPMDEQIAISTHIESATQKIASAITCKQAEIEKLKEYKATLINSAVTGKIKVI